jgi:hypothetical protein
VVQSLASYGGWRELIRERPVDVERV